jgi:uncharacterized protein with HEPN domain
MSAERTYTDDLVDILDAIVTTEQFIQGMTFDRFIQGDKTVFAVVRALEIIGRPPSASRKRSGSAIRRWRGVRWPGCATN